MSRKREQTHTRIMDAAYVLFRQRGFTRVNVDEISAAAGVTKRTLYSHFEQGCPTRGRARGAARNGFCCVPDLRAESNR